MVVISNDDYISGTCIAPHLFSCCPHHRMHPSEIPVYCNMITLVVGAEINKMNMVNRTTKRILGWLKIVLLPAGEELGRMMTEVLTIAIKMTKEMVTCFQPEGSWT